MKEIKAIIRPNKLPVLRDALVAMPGFPRHDGNARRGLQCADPAHSGQGQDQGQLTDYTPKVRIEIVAPDEVAETIFQRITEVAQTGHYGDGLVWITDIERAAFVFKTTPDPE